MVFDKHRIIDSDEYDEALNEYLDNGINYCANTIIHADDEDLEQLAADSFFSGCAFILKELQKRELIK